jgi:hypothetical protein
VGGVLAALVQLIHPADPQSPAQLAAYVRASAPVHLLDIGAILLILLGLPAAYAWQSSKAGIAGLIGMLMLFFGLPLFELLHSVLQISAIPALVRMLPDQVFPWWTTMEETTALGILQQVAQPLLLVGATLFAITTLRAGMVPRWPALLLLAAIVMQIGKVISGLDALATPAAVVFFLAFAAYGVSLLIARGPAQAAAPAPGAPLPTASGN